jgi:pimeloyl-ACP methyl ester carboxylesterase
VIERHDQPLVLLPGMGCSEALWSRLELDEEPILAVLQEPDLDAEVDRLLDLLPARFALAGLSLGAVVALALVRRAPHRVSGLCLMSANPHAPTPGQLRAWTEQRRRLASGSARDLQADLLSELLSPRVIARQPELVELTLAMAATLGDDATGSCGCRPLASTSGPACPWSAAPPWSSRPATTASAR